MDNPFEYPDDRSEFFEGSSEEEAHFYFTLREFEELIDRHGAEYVLGCMSLQQYRKLQSAFLDDDY